MSAAQGTREWLVDGRYEVAFSEVLREISDAERRAIGQWVNRSYCQPFRVRLDDGTLRLASQFEMQCALEVRRDEAYRRRERDGCCGAGPDEEGRCPEWPDRCPRYRESEAAVAWCAALVKWLDELNNQQELEPE